MKHNQIYHTDCLFGKHLAKKVYTRLTTCFLAVLLTFSLAGCGTASGGSSNSSSGGSSNGSSGGSGSSSNSSSGGSAADDDTKVSKTDFILNTIVSITLYGTEDDTLIDGAFALCREYEAKLSRTDENSEIGQLNARKTDTVSEDTAELIQKGLEYSELSGGALDISIGSVSSLWDFLADDPVVPDASAISEGIKHVNYKNVTLEGTKVTFSDPDTMLDLGAIAKGYIADRVKDYLLENGQNSALINLGGNILCVGSKPSGKDFKIGIQKPFDETGSPMITFSQSDLSVVTSGVYERYFEDEAGNFYHHILDSSTGYPVENDLYSVSIISDKSVDGDCLSTSCFCLGTDKALELIDSLDDVYAIFITNDFDVIYSDGLEEAFPDVEVLQ